MRFETYDGCMGLSEIISDIEATSEKLSDLMFDYLREASSAGTGRPQFDREFLKAQRSLDKALHVLRAIESTSN